MQTIILTLLLTLNNPLTRQTELTLLYPPMQTKIQEILILAKKQNLNIAVFETLRTPERQLYVFKKGYSQTMYSYHQLGLATDLVFLDSNGNWLWNVSKSKWEQLAKIVESVGLESGYRWKTLSDGPHAQLVIEGYTAEQLHAKLKELKSLKEFYKWLDIQLGKK